jgi:hypothetical protein
MQQNLDLINMNYFFRKYEFDSEEQYFDLQSQIEDSNYHTFVTLGILRENKFSVDVLWCEIIPETWVKYEIWDIEGNGSHTFLGWDFN